MKPRPEGRTPAGVAAMLTIMALGAAAPTRAQDTNILFPVDTLEELLAHRDFQILDRRGTRFLDERDRTSRVALDFGDGRMLVAKWAPAPRDGDEFNNSPRYEVAAYRIQSLFLEPWEYVVPPTVLRAFPLDWYRQLDPGAEATFRRTQSVLVALQYWLFNVTGDDFWDEDRFATDSLYAHHLGNFNILTYLISHNDENKGNYLISANPDNPRVFSVDNGLAFESEVSDQGAAWRRIRVKRFPAATIERLRGLTEDDLTRRLATLAQFRVQSNGELVSEEPGPPLATDRGVRVTDTVIQFGLTSWEIRGVWRRIQRFLDDVDDGDYQIF